MGVVFFGGGGGHIVLHQLSISQCTWYRSNLEHNLSPAQPDTSRELQEITPSSDHPLPHSQLITREATERGREEVEEEEGKQS